MGLVLALNPQKRYRGVTVPSDTWGGKRNGRLSALTAIAFIQEERPMGTCIQSSSGLSRSSWVRDNRTRFATGSKNRRDPSHGCGPLTARHGLRKVVLASVPAQAGVRGYPWAMTAMVFS